MCYCQMVLTPPTDMINVTSSSYIDGKFNYHNFKHINTMLHREAIHILTTNLAIAECDGPGWPSALYTAPSPTIT